MRSLRAQNGLSYDQQSTQGGAPQVLLVCSKSIGIIVPILYLPLSTISPTVKFCVVMHAPTLGDSDRFRIFRCPSHPQSLGQKPLKNCSCKESTKSCHGTLCKPPQLQGRCNATRQRRLGWLGWFGWLGSPPLFKFSKGPTLVSVIP